MSVLVLLWVGTLAVIYGSSYYEVSSENSEMLSRHAELFVLNSAALLPDGKPVPDMGGRRFENTPAFQLATFYSVAISDDGSLLEIKNPKSTVKTDEELESAARDIIDSGKTKGIKNNLIFRVADKGYYTLVAFMDNTVMSESMTTLFRYTLIFGGLAIIALFFLAVFLAKKIVKPIETSYAKQKQFISDAGHELKTPVSVISANAELLSREIGDNKWLSNIQYENERMGLLVSRLLELARAENSEVQTESIDFSRLVSGEALPFESVAFEKGLELNYNIDENIRVKGSSAQLKQLTAILIDNAVSHCSMGNEISVNLKSERSFAALSVINTGDEIPDEQKEQIFERFYRADSARSDSGGHYGLGLAIAKAIVEAHNGKISVDCGSGKVKFTALIPLEK